VSPLVYARRGLGGRLLAVQLVVLLTGALTLGVVALAVAPRVFVLHMDRAGETDPMVRSHAEQAFGNALGISLAVAASVSLVAALVISGLAVRRLATPVAQLADAADSLAGGSYDVDVPDPRLGDEFDRLAAAFRRMADTLAHTETVRRRLLSDLAHELRSPLSTLAAHVDGLEDGVVPATPATWQVLDGQLARLQRLATDIEQLSAAEEHAHPLTLQSADLAAVAAEAVAAAVPRYEAKGVDLSYRPGDPLRARLDAVRMQQVLANLLDNALRHTPAGGSVAVRAWHDHRDAVVEVTDTGEGIPPGELEAVFLRFHRVDPSQSRAADGSGLGLTIARLIVADHGGTLTAASDGAGRGATFTVRLPREAQHSDRGNPAPPSRRG
jgi:signal transduction histidine kinase